MLANSPGVSYLILYVGIDAEEAHRLTADVSEGFTEAKLNKINDSS